MSDVRDLADGFPEIEPRDGRRLRGTPIAAGQRFGKLVAIRPAPPKGKSTALHWQFRCDCGTFCVQKVSRVAAGRYVSCGCRHRETLEIFTAKAKARSAAAGPRRLSVPERRLAEAIYAAIISDDSVAEAVRIWLNPGRPPWATTGDDMRSLLASISSRAIEAVLARRQREAARTGPWEGTR